MWATLIALAIDNFFLFLFQVGQILMKLTYQGYYERGNDPSARRICWNKFIWFCGFSCCGCSQMIHIFCAPYLDIILMSSLTITAIITGVILSIFWLKEPFYAKYDVPAISLMVVGSVCLVLVSNKEKSDYKADQFVGIMTSQRALIYYFVGMLFTIAATVSCQWLSTNLARFEQQAHTYIKEHIAYSSAGSELTISRNASTQSGNSEFKHQFPVAENDTAILVESKGMAKVREELLNNENNKKNKWGTFTPSNELINLVIGLSATELATVAPSVNKNMRVLYRLPMIFLCLCMSMVSGLNQIVVKLNSTAFQDGEMFVVPNWQINSINVFLMFLTTLIILILMNISMGLYRQVDFVPVKESVFLIAWQISGIMFLREDRFYSWTALLILCVIVTVLITGIFIISCKPEKKQQKQEKRGASEDSPPPQIDSPTTQVQIKLEDSLKKENAVDSRDVGIELAS